MHDTTVRILELPTKAGEVLTTAALPAAIAIPKRYMPLHARHAMMGVPKMGVRAVGMIKLL